MVAIARIVIVALVIVQGLVLATQKKRTHSRHTYKRKGRTQETTANKSKDPRTSKERGLPTTTPARLFAQRHPTCFSVLVKLSFLAKKERKDSRNLKERNGSTQEILRKETETFKKQQQKKRKHSKKY